MQVSRHGIKGTGLVRLGQGRAVGTDEIPVNESLRQALTDALPIATENAV